MFDCGTGVAEVAMVGVYRGCVCEGCVVVMFRLMSRRGGSVVAVGEDCSVAVVDAVSWGCR